MNKISEKLIKRLIPIATNDTLLKSESAWFYVRDITLTELFWKLADFDELNMPHKLTKAMQRIGLFTKAKTSQGVTKRYYSLEKHQLEDLLKTLSEDKTEEQLGEVIFITSAIGSSHFAIEKRREERFAKQDSQGLVKEARIIKRAETLRLKAERLQRKQERTAKKESDSLKLKEKILNKQEQQEVRKVKEERQQIRILQNSEWEKFEKDERVKTLTEKIRLRLIELASKEPTGIIYLSIVDLLKALHDLGFEYERPRDHSLDKEVLATEKPRLERYMKQFNLERVKGIDGTHKYNLYVIDKKKLEEYKYV